MNSMDGFAEVNLTFKGDILDDHRRHLYEYVRRWLDSRREYHDERPGVRPTDWHIESCTHMGQPFYIIYYGTRRYGTVARIKRDTMEYYRPSGKVPKGVIDMEYEFEFRLSNTIINLDPDLRLHYHGIQCEAYTKNGERCIGRAMNGNKLCQLHLRHQK